MLYQKYLAAFLLTLFLITGALQASDHDIEERQYLPSKSFCNPLPHNIIKECLSWLPPKSLYQIACVNKELNGITKDESFLSAYAKRNFPLDADYLTNESGKIRERVYQHLFLMALSLNCPEKKTYLSFLNKAPANIEIVIKPNPLNRRADLYYLYGLKGDRAAIETTMERLFDELQDQEPLFRIIDHYIEQGSEWALQLKVNGLLEGINGYKRKRNTAVTFIDQLVENGNHWAIQLKVEGLSTGVYGYPENEKASVELVDKLIEQGSEWALQLKVNGLLEGINGYPKNLKALFEFNEELVKKGNIYALKIKIQGLDKGEYAYKQLPIYLKYFIQHDLRAISFKLSVQYEIVGLLTGQMGFKENEQQALEMIRRYGVHIYKLNVM